MPERGFASETWDSDDWFQDLSRDQRYLFIYLWTNNHCNQAGLYHVTLTTIAFETKFPKEELTEILHSLSPKVKWYPDESLVWVKNFLKRQSKSPKFLAAAAKSLTTIHHNGAVTEVLDYNLQRYNISIPYQYYMDKVSIPSGTGTVSSTVSGNISGEGRGEVSDKKISEISSLFEQEIGIITPSISDQLKDIAEQYPEGWFKEAMDEAVKANVRKLSYITAILERWHSQGFKSKKNAGGQHHGEPRKGVRPRPDQKRVRPFTSIPGDDEGEG